MTNTAPITVPAEFADMPFGEKLIVWAVRFWVQALKQEVNAQIVLRAGFTHAGAPAAHPALDGLMTVIATSAQGNIDIRCPKCPSISPDEQRIMGAIAAWQRNLDPGVADSFLSAWMPPDALRVARAPTTQLANALTGAGLAIRPRERVAHEPPREIPEDIDEGRAVTVH